MSRLSRITQTIFGTGGSIGVFGSGADGTLATTTSASTAQSKSYWINGWLGATLGASKFPAIEDLNSTDFVHSSQIAYILQQGIPEYDSGTTYYTNQMCMQAGTYNIYGSVTNGNVGNALSNGTYWQLLGNLANLSSLTDSFVNVSTTGGTVSLTTAQSNTQVIELSGTLASNAIVQLSSTSIKGQWLVWNNTSGAYTLTFGYASGAAVTIPQGTAVTVYGDGTNIYGQTGYALLSAANTFTNNQTIAKAVNSGALKLGVNNSGTGASTYAILEVVTNTANSYLDLYLNDNSGTPVAGIALGAGVTSFMLPVTYGVTSSIGSNNTQLATTAYVLNAVVGAASQAYTDVTASRAIGTTYTNSTNRPIYVAIEISTGASAGSYSATLTIGGNLADASGLYLYTGGTNTQLKLTGVVGIGETYTVTSSGTTLTKWYERR